MMELSPVYNSDFLRMIQSSLQLFAYNVGLIPFFFNRYRFQLCLIIFLFYTLLINIDVVAFLAILFTISRNRSKLIVEFSF